MARDEDYGYQGSSSAGGSIGSAAGKIAKKVSSSVSKPGNTTRNPSRTVKRTVRSRGSSGGSVSRPSGNSGSSRLPSNKGGGGGGTSKPGPARPVPKTVKPAVPSINSYLGTDSAYQDVVRGGKRSLADYLSDLGRRRGESETQYGTTKASMERDRVQQLEDLRNEFASRGLINSGLFGDEQGKFQQQFTQQQSTLDQQQAALIADLLSQEKNFRREQELALEAARQEALQRRAAKYKIGA